MKINTFYTFLIILPKLQLIYGNCSQEPQHPIVFLPNSTDFEEITKCSGFIDKTLFIQEFFNFQTKYHIFTRPRKFGKSTNMNMLKRFVQLEVDQGGKIKRKYQTYAYQLFTNRTLNLRISSCDNTINDHLAKYAVIHIEFKGVMTNTFKETLQNIRERVRRACLPYEWMIEILHKKFQRTKDSNIAQQVRFLKKAIYGTMNLDITMKSLSLLAKVLLNYFRRKLFIFIDDYDQAMDYGLRYAHRVKYDPTKIRYVMNTMMEKLFDEPLEHIAYIMITGVAFASPSLLYSFQIHLEHHRFLHSFEMASFFGFTDDQVADLLDRHGIDPDEKYKMAEYYSGYASPEWNVTLYNTFSVLSYLANFDQSNITYPLSWIDPGSLDFILEALKNSKIYTSWLQLLVIKTGYFIVQSYTHEKRWIKLAARIKNQAPLGPKKVIVFLWYCQENGYITKADDITWVKHRLPNKEIEIEFTEILKRFYRLHVANIIRPMYRTIKKLIGYKNVDKEIFNLKRQLQMLLQSEFKFDDCKELHHCSFIYFSMKTHFNHVITYFKTLRMDTVHIVANETKTLTIIAVKYKNTLKKALKNASLNETNELLTPGKTIRYIGIKFNLPKQTVDVAYFSPNDQQEALYTNTAEKEEEQSEENYSY